MKITKILGKKIEYKNIPDLAKKINIGDTIKEKRDNAKIVLNNLDKKLVIYNQETGDFEKFNLKENPLLIRKFLDIKRVDKNLRDAILTSNVQLEPEKGKYEGHVVAIGDYIFNENDLLNTKYTIDIRIITSSTDGTVESQSSRKLNGEFKGNIIGKLELSELKYMMLSYVSKQIRRSQPIIQKNNKFFKDSRIAKWIKETEKTKRYNYDDFSDFTRSVLSKITKDYSFCNTVIIEDVSVTSFSTQSTLDLKTMKMKLNLFSDITNLYNELITIKYTNNNCVVSYLQQLYKKINIIKYFSRLIPNYETEGVSTTDIKTFCSKYDIKMIAYDIIGDVIDKYIPVNNKRNHKSLIYIAYNSHIYPVKNKLLNAVNTSNLKEMRLTKEEVNKKFNELLSNRIIPSNIKIASSQKNNKLVISSFVHDKIFYYSNEDYELCKSILKLFDIDDHMSPYINRHTIMKTLETLYDIKKTHSFFPQLKTVTANTFNYITDNEELMKKYEDFKTIDKNKCYPMALYLLEFIQTLDIRKREKIKINNNEHEINKYYLYIARPELYNILMPNEGFYTGEDLLYIQNEGVKFDMLYYYIPDIQENPFKKLIEDYYNKTVKITTNENKDILKRIINIWIGKFEKGCDEVKKYNTLNKICNKEEATRSNGLIYEYDTDVNFVMNEKETYDIYTRKLIKFQLLNRSRRMLYEKMKEMNLKDRNIIQIKTDSITYLEDEETKEPLDIDKNDFKKWKLDTFSLLNSSTEHYLETINIQENENYKSILYEGIAGCGKTYRIINKVIPSLTDSYIVLSPSHASIEDYRLSNINCDVIQKYGFTNTIPEENIIIVDEIGLCDTSANNTIYKCILSGKRVMCYGDFKQLYPVCDEHCNATDYIKYCYKSHRQLNVNHRNNFTNEYYTSLINNTINLKKEIKKYNTPIYDAEFIVCDTNTQCEKYNDLIMKHKNITMYDVDTLILCKTNKYRNINIYNNFLLKFVSCDDTQVILKDKSNTYTVKLSDYKNKKMFRPGYARTLYNLQGRTINSYHAPKEVIDKFSESGRETYTLISRLKQEIIKKECVSTMSEQKHKIITFDTIMDNIIF